MAVIWQRKTKAGLYQVRTAGHTVRLYKDGVFHSHYNPNHVVTRGVWDLLVLPCLLHPPGTLQRVLMLGVGGGAAVHLLNHFVQPRHITAIELDPLHLSVAKRFFKVNNTNTQLLQGDAIAWVQKQASKARSPGFDLIIDDLYGEEQGEPVRAIEANTQWCEQLHSLLNDNGLLVSNFVTAQELKGSAYVSKRRVRRRFNSAFKFTNPLYQNQIAALSKRSCSLKAFRDHCSEHSKLSNRRYQQTFSVKKL